MYNWNPGPDQGEATQTPSSNKLQASGTSLLYHYVQRQLITSTVAKSRNGSTSVTLVGAQSNFSTRTPLTLRSRPAPSTCTTPDAKNVIKQLKGYVVFLFIGLSKKNVFAQSCVLARATFKRQAANGQKHFTVLCLHICNIFAKKRGMKRAKKLILTIRTIMTSQHVDLVAGGDFNGTAWRNTSKGKKHY